MDPLTKRPYEPIEPAVLEMLLRKDPGYCFCSVPGTLFYIISRLLASDIERSPTTLSFVLDCKPNLAFTYTRLYTRWLFTVVPPLHVARIDKNGIVFIPRRTQLIIYAARHAASSGISLHLVESTLRHLYKLPDISGIDYDWRMILISEPIEDLGGVWRYALPLRESTEDEAGATQKSKLPRSEAGKITAPPITLASYISSHQKTSDLVSWLPPQNVTTNTTNQNIYQYLTNTSATMKGTIDPMLVSKRPVLLTDQAHLGSRPRHGSLEDYRERQRLQNLMRSGGPRTRSPKDFVRKQSPNHLKLQAIAKRKVPKTATAATTKGFDAPYQGRNAVGSHATSGAVQAPPPARSIYNQQLPFVAQTSATQLSSAQSHLDMSRFNRPQTLVNPPFEPAQPLATFLSTARRFPYQTSQMAYTSNRPRLSLGINHDVEDDEALDALHHNATAQAEVLHARNVQWELWSSLEARAGKSVLPFAIERLGYVDRLENRAME